MILNKEKTIHMYKVVDVNNPESFIKESQTNLIDESDGEDRLDVVCSVFDSNGRKIMRNSEVVRSASTGEIIHQAEAFLCEGCHKFHNLDYMVKEVASEAQPQSTAADVQDDDYDDKAIPCTIARGYCRDCWWGGEAYKNFLRNLVSWLSKPFKALQDNATLLGVIMSFCLVSSNLCGMASNQSQSSTVEASMKYQYNSRRHISDIEAELDRAEKFGVANTPAGKPRFTRMKNDPQNITKEDLEWLRRTNKRREKEYENEKYRTPFLPEPTFQEVSSGDIQAYHTLGDVPVAFDSVWELQQQGRYIGRTGGTKSTASYYVQNSVMAAGISTVIIASKGDDQFHGLARRHPGKVLLLKVGRDVFHNPWLYPYKMLPYFLKTYSRHDSRVVLDNDLKISLKQVRSENGVATTFNRILRNIPLVQAKKDFPSIRAQLKQSICNVLTDIESSSLWMSTACQKGLDFAAIIKKGISVIIDTSEIAGTDHEELLVTSLIVQIREDVQRDADLSRRKGTLLFFNIDEGTTLAAASKDRQKGLAPLVHLATLTRATGIALWIGYHSPRHISEILHSAYVLIVTNLSNGDDINTIKRAAFLTNDQAEMLRHLPSCVALVIMAGRHTSPFLIKYDYIPAFKAFTEDEIAANNAAILAKLPPIIPDKHVPITCSSKNTCPTQDTGEESAILNDLALRPFLNLSDRAKSITLPSSKKLNYRQLRAILEGLQKLGYCHPLSAQMKHRGRSSEYWVLSENGWTRINRPLPSTRQGSGVNHVFVQRLHQHVLKEAGVPSTTLEARLMPGGKPVDVGVKCPMTGLDIALETCLSTFSSEYSSALKSLQEGWSRVIVSALTREDLIKLEQSVTSQNAHIDSRITLCLPGHFCEFSLEDIYDYPGLVFNPKKVKSKT